MDCRLRTAWGQAKNQLLRGGAFNNNPNNLRAANRNNNTPDNRNNNIGFRCAAAGPSQFLKGQVRPVHGRGASAEREKSRPVPGWASNVGSTKDKAAPPCVVGSVEGSTLRAGPPNGERGERSLQFYLPNFEDLVDPGYDFIRDEPSPDRGNRFLHDWYAHQFFDEPIFDGVLMSKTVVPSRVEALIRKAGNIHTFLSLDPTVPVMGDCGAYTYRNCQVPPYTTSEILDYYETLGFTYGVSIDHLIFSSFSPEEQLRRWNLTLRNAREFLQQHRAGGYTFTPVGIAQGTSPERYAEAVHQLVAMGYDHLALGGLARSGDRTIREVLEAVSPELVEGIDLHLFGVARLSLIPDLLRYGVTMVDSAAPIRRAFLGGNEDNYWAADGKRYAAIRIPDATSKRTKRGVISPDDVVNGDIEVDSTEGLVKLEQRALSQLRAYDRGEADLQETLDAVLAYDRLFGKNRDHELWYRRVLEDRPWQECGCPICQRVDVEVIIFRGNNRNRRRGFHNVKVFYEQFKEAVNEHSQE
jgi:hypothetical protein